MALLVADTHLAYLPHFGRSGISLSHLSRFALNVSVFTPVIFLRWLGMQLKARSILLAGLLKMLVISDLFNLLPSTWVGIPLLMILHPVPRQFVFKFNTFSLMFSICCQPNIIRYLSLLLSKLYIFNFFNLSW